MLAQVVATKQRKSGVQTEVAVKERVNGPLNWFRPLRDHPRFQALLDEYADDVEH